MKNTKQHYGWVTITIHWLVAVIIIGLFSLGFWMVELGYYHPWYKQGPNLHRSIGIVLFALMVFRLILKIIQTKNNFGSSARTVSLKCSTKSIEE